MVRDYSFFLEDLPSLPLNREIDFMIELELINKGFIQSSVLPMGASMLFVNKKDGMLRCVLIIDN